VPPAPACAGTGPAYPEVTRAICLVPSAWFPQAPRCAPPVHLCRFRVRSMSPALFPGPLPQPAQSDKGRHGFAVVTSGGRGNVHPLPIGYGLRPRLRGRLTLRGLALRRNPWTSGGRVSRPACRYSCPHSRFPCLHRASRRGFAGLGNAPLPRAIAGAPTASAGGLSPVTFSPRDSWLDQ
jgi:hypothetical protein